jgi:hypothetical protein
LVDQTGPASSIAIVSRNSTTSPTLETGIVSFPNSQCVLGSEEDRR